MSILAVVPATLHIQWVLKALSPEIKWLLAGHEAVCSPPRSAEVKNVWSYTCTPPWCGA